MKSVTYESFNKKNEPSNTSDQNQINFDIEEPITVHDLGLKIEPTEVYVRSQQAHRLIYVNNSNAVSELIVHCFFSPYFIEWSINFNILIWLILTKYYSMCYLASL